MLSSTNRVITGDYRGYHIKSSWGKVRLKPPLFSQHRNHIEIDRNSVRRYEVITCDHRKNAVSSIIRGLIGKYLFGSVGMIGGAMSAKNTGIYTLSLEFHNGERSLIEIDDRIYKAIIKCTF